jgi:hypothetical protein
MDKAKKEYLETICNENIEFQRTGHYDLMYMMYLEMCSSYWEKVV